MYQRVIVVAVSCFLLSCGGSIDSRFPMEKRFWEPEDYGKVYRTIRFNTPKGERYPELSNPETSRVFKKLIDRQNYLVVLDDEQLGLSHRNNVATKFFDEYRKFSDVYYSTDREDKFVYGMELVELYKFGLDLQVYYFKLGNDNIIKEADDPNASSITSVIKSNESVIFKNYNNYLDYVNKESGFNENELKAYCEGINQAFSKLFETFPDGNFNITKNKADLMIKKAQSEILKNALQNLLDKITELNEARQEESKAV